MLAGERLIVAGSNGALINVDPVTGSFQSQTRRRRVAVTLCQPVVANSTLYILDDEGRADDAFR